MSILMIGGRWSPSQWSLCKKSARHTAPSSIVCSIQMALCVGCTSKQAQLFVSGKPIPAQGAHINMHASGPFRGETMEAEMELVDHVRFLPNGRLELNIYGVLTDKDGRRIFFQSTGVAEPSSDGTLPLAENIYMHSNHQAYEWMNTKQFWA